MANQNNDLENSEKSETGSQKIIISKSLKKCESTPRRHKDLETSNISPPILSSRHFESRDSLPFGLLSPTPDVPTVDVSEQEQQYRERIPPRINSTPNFTSNTRTSSGTGHPSLRFGIAQLTPQSAEEMKYDDEKLSNITPLLTHPGVRPEPTNNPRSSFPSSVAAQASGVFGLLSRLTSIISSRPRLVVHGNAFELHIVVLLEGGEEAVDQLLVGRHLVAHRVVVIGDVVDGVIVLMDIINVAVPNVRQHHPSPRNPRLFLQHVL